MTDDKEQQLHEIEIGITEAKQLVALSEAYQRLKAHPDFKLVIDDEYFRNEASRLVELTAEPNLGAAQQAQVQAAIRGIGELRQFLLILERKGAMAREAIAAGEQALVEIENDLDVDQER